jgi:DNA-binding response OmpR family regulator
MKFGIRDMVMKPFDRKEFAELVRAVLDRTSA